MAAGKFTSRLVPLLAPPVIRLYFSTMKIRWLCPPPPPALEQHHFLYAFWHQRLLVFTYTHQDQGVTVMISRHADGALIADTVERMGFHTIRGSSTRGGKKALFEMSRQRGTDLAITPDGPRGPRHTVKNGLVYLAAKTGCPIIPGTCSYGRFWRFNSWDRFILPKPGTRALIQTRAPIVIPPEAAGDIKRYRKKLEAILKDLTEETDRDFESLWKRATYHKPYFFRK